jgi:hypothetical protein
MLLDHHSGQQQTRQPAASILYPQYTYYTREVVLLQIIKQKFKTKQTSFNMEVNNKCCKAVNGSSLKFRMFKEL